MDFRSFVKNQIEKGNKNWESRSALIRASGEKANGHNNRILKEHEDKFLFGPIADLKNKEIKKYFDKQPKNSLISVEGAVKIINQTNYQSSIFTDKGFTIFLSGGSQGSLSILSCFA